MTVIACVLDGDNVLVYNVQFLRVRVGKLFVQGF